MRNRRFALAIIGMVGATGWGPPVARAVIVGQIDTFTNAANGVVGWDGGSGSVRIATGGPNGVGDAYMRISAANSNLGTYNSVQWTGDYLAAGVNKIRFSLANLGATQLQVRITLFCDFAGDFTSTNSMLIPPNGVWNSYDFGLATTDLSFVPNTGTGVWSDCLANVRRLLIRHQSGNPGAPGQQFRITGSLGLDNIQALPEPATLGLLVMGGLLLLRRRRSA